MAYYQLIKEQKLKVSQSVLWDFISNPKNLEKITPQGMGFQIQTRVPERIYPGLMIGYKVTPLAGLPMNWLTEITHVDDLNFFVDEQRMGPYKIWHHEHQLHPVEGGVLMRDIVTYKPPFSVIGSLANTFIIKKKLNQIFDYREEVLANTFGEINP